MTYYFVGFRMTDPSFDYEKLHCALMLLRARKVSDRIYMCAIDPTISEHIFSLTRKCLTPQDEMMVQEVPPSMRPVPLRIAA